jgi:hypothetical protein
MNKFRSTRMNQRGFSLHFLLPLIVVAVVALVGYKLLFASHADNTNSIVYIKGNAPDGQSVAVNSSGTITLGDLKRNVYLGNPIWVNNDSNIYFYTLDLINHESKIYSARPNGKGAVVIANLKNEYIDDMAWSQADQKLLIVESSSPAFYPGVQIVSMNYGATNPTVIFSSPSSNPTDVQFSPNGSKILFEETNMTIAGIPGPSNRLVTMDANGSDLVFLPTEGSNTNQDGESLAISPHGAWSSNNEDIVYKNYSCNYSFCGREVIDIINADGTGGPVQLFTNNASNVYVVGAGDKGPIWSQTTGDIIALMRTPSYTPTNGQYDLYTLSGWPTKATSTVPLTIPGYINGEPYNPEFDISPNGQDAVYTTYNSANSTFQLQSIPLAGGSPTLLDSTISDGSGSQAITYVNWSQ